MENQAPLASAAALARTPLFSQLGRVDLAKLAGELEERTFARGRVIVREGEPGDALYVIKSGVARIVVGAETSADGTDITLDQGECFGEMALLTDSARAATVVAHTDVIAWRLSRQRFDALVARERPIARSIERALSQRLALTSHDLSAVRGPARRLARTALGMLGPPAVALLRGLTSRSEWSVETVSRICERMGEPGALADLESVPGFTVRSGARVVVDETAVGLVGDALGLPDPRWLEAASEELAREGESAGALDLALRAGAGARARALLAAAHARLVETASLEDLDHWVVRGRTLDPALGSALVVLQAEIVAHRRAGSRTQPRARRTRSALNWIWHWLRIAGLGRLAGATTAVAIFAVVAVVLPTPAGLERAGLLALGAIVATVPLLVFDVLPDYVVMLLLAVTLVVPGTATAADMLGGFATPAWLMILTLLVVGTAVSRSGLMFRLVLMSLERLPGNYLTQSLVLSGTGIFMTAGLTSGATRIALGVPIARGIADSLGFARQSAGAAAIGLLAFFAFVQLQTLFLTGSFSALVVHDLLPSAARTEVTWWRWLIVALPPAAVMFVAYPAFLYAYFRPRVTRAVDVRAVRVQEELLGPLTRAEIWSVIVLVALVVGFATRPYHGVAPAWMAVAVFVVLFVVGVLDQSALQTGGGLGLLVYSGVILSLGNVFSALQIDAWLSGLVRSGMPALVTNRYGFVLVLALASFALRFIVPWMTASTLLVLVAIPVAEGLGLHPFIPALVILMAGDHTFLPYINLGYSLVYFGSDGQLFSHAQARWPLMMESLIRIAAIVASVPAWQALGLL